MFNYMIRFFTKSFQFSGRATRKEFWVPNIVLALIAALIGSRSRSEKAEGRFTALIMLPSLSITTRRYHDAGISGWYHLPQCLSLLLLPFAFMGFVGKWIRILVVAIMVIVNLIGFFFTLLPSDSANKYGIEPVK